MKRHSKSVAFSTLDGGPDLGAGAAVEPWDRPGVGVSTTRRAGRGGSTG
ncbi:hypothetical protein [Arthrobacter sp. E3]|nr:hypothetical protein [Arthrobacter sp. E3]